ncbi:hypothetical protein DXT76_03230, partial [Halobacillus trueperi]
SRRTQSEEARRSPTGKRVGSLPPLTPIMANESWNYLKPESSQSEAFMKQLHLRGGGKLLISSFVA